MPGRCRRSTAPVGRRPRGPARARPCARSVGVRSALAVSRSREMPSETVGGRKQPTLTPPAAIAAAAASAASGSPMRTPTTAASGGFASRPAERTSAKSRVAAAPDLVGQLGLGTQDLHRCERRPDRCWCEPGVEDERPRRVDEMIDHCPARQHRTALRPQRLRQRRGQHHVRRTREARRSCCPGPAGAEHAQRVGLVDHQSGAGRGADRGEQGQRRHLALDREHGVGHHQSPLLRAFGEGRGDRRDIPVRHDDHPRPGQPAGVDDRGVVLQRRRRPATRGRTGRPPPPRSRGSRWRTRAPPRRPPARRGPVRARCAAPSSR